MPTGVWLWAECDRWVAVGDQPGLVIVWQCPNRAIGIGGTACVRPNNTQAAVVQPEPGAVASVSWLDPAITAIEREVDSRAADTFGERAGVVVAGVTGLHVDIIVRSSHQHIRVVGVNCNGRLVLFVLRKWRRGASNADTRVRVEGQRRRRQRQHQQCYERDSKIVDSP